MKQQNPYIILNYPGHEPAEIVIKLGDIRKALTSLECMLHPFGSRILKEIDHLGFAATFDNLVVEMKADQNLIRQHLKALIRNKIVLTSRTSSNQVLYYRNEEKYAKVMEIVNQLNFAGSL